MYRNQAYLKHFKRIQDIPLLQDVFDDVHNFPDCGGGAVFIGAVRNHHNDKQVKSLKYTAYSPLAEKLIRQIEVDVQRKFGAPYIRVVHRVGMLDIGELAIIAICYAPHRKEAFAACEEAVERVKHEAPIWKLEFYADGTSEHVEGCCIRTD